MRRLSSRNRVAYVEPQLSLTYMLRAGIKRPVAGAGPRWEGRVALLSPPAALPAHTRSPAAHRLNTVLLRRFLQVSLKKLGWSPSILWFYDPVLVGLCEAWPGATVAYDCVDRHDAYPGRGRLVKELERDLVSRADAVVVTSQALLDDFAPMRKDVHHIPNGVDLALFSKPAPLPADLIPPSGPRLGFAGGIGEWVDTELLQYLADQRPLWRLCLAGPVAQAVRISELARRTNVSLLGRIPREQVPAFLHEMDVCLLPFKVDRLTAAVSPLKLFEYFAAGKPVVSTPLEEVRAFAPMATIAATPGQFLQAVEESLAADDALSGQRRLVAQNHSWSVLLPRLEEVVAGRVVAGRCG